MALILIVTDILSYYNLIRNDGFQLINRHYNCPLAYVLIVPCLLYSLITSLLKLIK